MAEIIAAPTGPNAVVMALRELLKEAEAGKYRTMVGLLMHGKEFPPEFTVLQAGPWWDTFATHLGMMEIMREDMIATYRKSGEKEE